MKKNYILAGILLLSAITISTQKSDRNVLFNFERIQPYLKHHLKYSNGGSASNSGAPGDHNCTTCHAGNVQSGSEINNLSIFNENNERVYNYIPGNTYKLHLKMNNNPEKKGFQSIAMNANAQISGNYSEIIDVLNENQNETQSVHVWPTGRASHTNLSNTNTSDEWVWKWTAPVTDEGYVIFYVATLVANNDGNVDGDMVYLSQHLISSSLGIQEENIPKTNFTAGYSPEKNTVQVKFNSLIVGDMYFNLIDQTGRSVFTTKTGKSNIGLNEEKIILPEDLKNGYYIVNMFVNNNIMEQKIMIQK